jgi:antitoxin component HigA of HigAB toxin-antitoxin module
VKIRLLAFSIFVTNQISYKPIIKFLRQNNVDIFDLFNRPLEDNNLPNNIQNVFDEFKKSTINELWDSPEEIIENFQDDDQYQKLISEHIGFNVIQFHQALVTTNHMPEWTEYIIKLAQTLLDENNIPQEKYLKPFNEISNYCRGLTYNALELDSNLPNPEFLFKYDIEKWTLDSHDQTIDRFEFSKLRKIMFTYTPEEIELFRNNMDIYGISTNGMAQVLKRISSVYLWRNPITIS